MSTLSSKQAQSQGLADPLLVLASIVAVSLLVLLGARAGTVYDSLVSGHESHRFGKAGATAQALVSFASDEQYWNANCSHGWAARPACDQIVSRAQWCGAGTGSAYCAEYKSHMQQFHPRQ